MSKKINIVSKVQNDTLIKKEKIFQIQALKILHTNVLVRMYMLLFFGITIW